MSTILSTHISRVKIYADNSMCNILNVLVSGAGPFGLLNLVAERCGGIFDDIDEVISERERKDFMAKYKQAAGFAIENLNSSPPTIQT